MSSDDLSSITKELNDFLSFGQALWDNSKAPNDAWINELPKNMAVYAWLNTKEKNWSNLSLLERYRIILDYYKEIVISKTKKTAEAENCFENLKTPDKVLKLEIDKIEGIKECFSPNVVRVDTGKLGGDSAKPIAGALANFRLKFLRILGVSATSFAKNNGETANNNDYLRISFCYILKLSARLKPETQSLTEQEIEYLTSPDFFKVEEKDVEWWEECKQNLLKYYCTELHQKYSNGKNTIEFPKPLVECPWCGEGRPDSEEPCPGCALPKANAECPECHTALTPESIPEHCCPQCGYPFKEGPQILSELKKRSTLDDRIEYIRSLLIKLITERKSPQQQKWLKQKHGDLGEKRKAETAEQERQKAFDEKLSQLEAPGDLRCEADYTKGVMRFTWKAVAAAEGYLLKRDGEKRDGEEIGRWEAGHTEGEDGKPVIGAKVKYNLYPMLQGCEGKHCAQIECGYFPPVSDIKGNTDNGSVDLTWKVLGVRTILRREDKKNEVLDSSEGEGSGWFLDKDVTEDCTYCYIFTVRYKDGESPSVPYTVKVVSHPMPEAENLRIVERPDNGTIRFQWDWPAEAQEFWVQLNGGTPKHITRKDYEAGSTDSGCYTLRNMNFPKSKQKLAVYSKVGERTSKGTVVEFPGQRVVISYCVKKPWLRRPYLLIRTNGNGIPKLLWYINQSKSTTARETFKGEIAASTQKELRIKLEKYGKYITVALADESSANYILEHALAPERFV